MTSPVRSVNGRRAVAFGGGPLFVLALTQALEQGERLSLAQAVDGIKGDFGVSDAALGLLPTAMILVGVIGAFPFGFLADRTRRTRLVGGGMAVWTAAMGLNGFAPNYGGMLAARLGVGAVEANGPATVSLLSDYYPVHERAKRLGLYQSGALLGAIAGLIGGGAAVEHLGWEWAFWMWVPPGLVVAALVWRLPEPRRGDQDADFHDDMAAAPGLDGVDVSSVARRMELPAPTRVGTLDYQRAGARDVYRELLTIRSMWFGLAALTISQTLLVGLQFWAVEFFKRAHDLQATEAGIFTTVFGLGAAVGVFGGGFLADRLLYRGFLNARVHVVAVASITATALLIPAFLVPNLVASGALLTVGGFFLTLPIAPGEAMVNDVVVAQLRGRAATLRSVVRSLAAAGPAVIGLLSAAFGLQTAIVSMVPLYAVGGFVMFFAARTYPADLAYVGAETRRLRALEGEM